jgi:catechol 2,3-dioxygenase-like lactoylglutathione lyase family enzyme
VPDVFDHVTLRVSDLEASRRFYELALAELGYGEPYRGDHFFEWEDLSISIARSDRPVTRNSTSRCSHAPRETRWTPGGRR